LRQDGFGATNIICGRNVICCAQAFRRSAGSRGHRLKSLYAQTPYLIFSLAFFESLPSDLKTSSVEPSVAPCHHSVAFKDARRALPAERPCSHEDNDWAVSAVSGRRNDGRREVYVNSRWRVPELPGPSRQHRSLSWMIPASIALLLFSLFGVAFIICSAFCFQGKAGL